MKREPYPLPEIQHLLKKLQGFQHTTALDVSVGHLCIKLCQEVQKTCAVVLPWSKCKCIKIPMGVSAIPDIFQEKMHSLIEGLECVQCYLDNLLILSNGSFEDHIDEADTVLPALNQAGLKVNEISCKKCDCLRIKCMFSHRLF